MDEAFTPGESGIVFREVLVNLTVKAAEERLANLFSDKLHQHRRVKRRRRANVNASAIAKGSAAEGSGTGSATYS